MDKAYDFADHLARFGPDAGLGESSIDVREAEAYCRSFARSHEENFPVLSFAVPSALRQPFANVYTYCRWADDLGDEIGDTARSLELLDWWREEVERMYGGHPRHPVMVALGATVRKFEIPAAPFLDLISAFRQDQTTTRYATFDELRDYCRRSADPVGRLVLYLLRSATDDRLEMSDAICTGLQLANFWQDVRVDDREKGRIYIPAESMRQFGVTEEDIHRDLPTREFRELMRSEVDRAEGWLLRGLPLARTLHGRFRLMVALFGHGGLAILRRIRLADYNVLVERPRLRRRDRAGALLRALWDGWLKPSVGERGAQPDRTAGKTA